MQLWVMTQVLQGQQCNIRTQTSSPTCYWGSNAGTMAADHASMELRVYALFLFFGPCVVNYNITDLIHI